MTVKRFILFVTGLMLIIAFVYYIYPEQALPKGAIVDKIVVYKSQHRLEAYEKGKVLKAYTISIGQQSVGAKEYEGDLKTPEGSYVIDEKNPHSDYHKNLGISYPNRADIVRCQRLGKPTGGAIKIHGLKNGQGFISKFQRFRDWTWGCIALTDQEVDELYKHTAIGTPIVIYP